MLQNLTLVYICVCVCHRICKKGPLLSKHLSPEKTIVKTYQEKRFCIHTVAIYA